MSIKLKEITFHGFKTPNRTANIVFVNGNISIIHGMNGVGKTSLFKGLYAFFKQDETYLSELKTNSIVCKYSIPTSTEDKIARVVFNSKKNCYDWDINCKDLMDASSLFISIDRNSKTINYFDISANDIESFFETKHSNSNALAHFSKNMKKNISVELIDYFKKVNESKQKRIRNLDQFFSLNHVYVESLDTQSIETLLVNEYSRNLFEEMRRVNRVLSKTLNSILHAQVLENDYKLNSKLTAEELLNNKEKLIKSLEPETLEVDVHFDFLTNDKELRRSLINHLNQVNCIDDANEIIGHRILSKVFLNLIEELRRESMLSRFNKLLDNFNERLINDKKVIVTSEKAEIKFKNNDSHSLDDLSSGEKHLLVFLVCVLFKCEGRDFLFIDEPEMSLNTAWQSEILILLNQLVPETQIIVASHSPYIVEGRTDYLNELVVEYV